VKADPLTFLSQRLAMALRTAPDGLAGEDLDDLDIPQLGWRLRELHSHGFVVGEDRGVLVLVHDPERRAA
jgi:hypothetical protein